MFLFYINVIYAQTHLTENLTSVQQMQPLHRSVEHKTAVLNSPPGHRTSNVCNTSQSTTNENVIQNIGNIMQRQSDITAQSVQQQHSASLPPRAIPIFDGDPLQYGSFIMAFEQGVERKVTNLQDCLCYLEQYTRGQRRELIRSCYHMPNDQGYDRAKYLLKEHFGNEMKIGAAYMEKALNWTPINAEFHPYSCLIVKEMNTGPVKWKNRPKMCRKPRH